MVFSSALFLFMFLPFTLLLYYIVPKKYTLAGNILLLCASLIFYAWGEPAAVFVMIYSILMNCLFGVLTDKLKENKFHQKIVLISAVSVNAIILGYYKYFNFFTEYKFFSIGLIFFTFRAISYVADVYSGKIDPHKNILNLALYISFFPQLIAGPVVRYADMESQFENRRPSIEKTAAGAQKFIAGLAKIILIANPAATFADEAFALTSPASLMAWIGAVCFTLQIYFYFSGYSDMALGLGKMFGFGFPENFDYPYASSTIRSFWKRWHISLSNWFRDYLYIPLGGDRKGSVRTYTNLLVVFAATGILHGTGWSFLIWGIYHAIFVMLERGAWRKILNKLPKAVMWLYTMFVVVIGWVIFRAGSIVKALEYLKSMFNFSTEGLSETFENGYMNNVTVIAVLAGIIFSAPVLPYVKQKLFGGENHFECTNLTPLKQAASWASIAGCLGILILSVIFLTGPDYNPLQYFKF